MKVSEKDTFLHSIATFHSVPNRQPVAGDLKQIPMLHKIFACSLYSKLKIPLAPAILFAIGKISVQLHLFPKSQYGNFPTHNVRCRNKEIAVPCSPMRLHGTSCVG